MSGPSYQDFARIYDAFMADAPHEQWLRFFRDIDLSGQVVADLGCGTGVVAVALALQGCQVVGIDASETMLTAAADRARINKTNVQWLCEDMREFVLPKTADAVISTCDSLNYLLSVDELCVTLERCHRALRPGGSLYFDMLGPGRLETLTDGVWFDVRDDAELWFTSEVSETGRIEYDVHAFFETEPGSTVYRRVIEHHTEQYYDQVTVANLLHENGFEIVQVQGDFGQSTVDVADRLVFQARRG